MEQKRLRQGPERSHTGTRRGPCSVFGLGREERILRCPALYRLSHPIGLFGERLPEVLRGSPRQPERRVDELLRRFQPHRDELEGFSDTVLQQLLQQLEEPAIVAGPSAEVSRAAPRVSPG